MQHQVVILHCFVLYCSNVRLAKTLFRIQCLFVSVELNKYNSYPMIDSLVLCNQKYYILGNLTVMTMFSVRACSFLGHVSRLGIHVRPYDWLPLGLSLLWRWHGLSDDLSTHQAGWHIAASSHQDRRPLLEKHQQALGPHITHQSPLATLLLTGQLQSANRTNWNILHVQNTCEVAFLWEAIWLDWCLSLTYFS